MSNRKPYTRATSMFFLAVAVTTCAFAQNTPDQSADRERQEALGNANRSNPGAPADDGAASTYEDNNHADTLGCADLLADENRTGNNSGSAQASREGNADQGRQGSGRAPGAGASRNGSGGDTTLEECRNQQNAIPNGRPNGSGQGASSDGFRG